MPLDHTVRKDKNLCPHMPVPTLGCPLVPLGREFGCYLWWMGHENQDVDGGMEGPRGVGGC